MIMIDKLSYSSKIRHKSPQLKTFLAICTLLICVIANSYIISIIILIAMGGLAIKYSKSSFCYYMKLMLIPITFLLLSTITLIINYTQIKGDICNVSFASGYLSISRISLDYGVRLIVKALAAVSCMYFLALTTPIIDLILVLRRVHCPHILLELTLLIYRYIFIISDMASALQVAQKCRLGNKDFRTTIKSMGSILSVLLIRSLKKSSLLYDAMESRCYNGEINVLSRNVKAEKKEIILVILFEIVLIVIAIVTVSYR